MLKREKKKPHFTTNEIVWRTTLAVAVVAGLFSLIVSVLLIANYLQIRAITPLDNPEVLKLRQQLATAPEADPNLVRQIESLDLLARKAFFTSQAHLKMGGYLLLGGVVVLLGALRLAAKFKSRVPAPEVEPPAATYWLSRTHARTLVGVTATVWVTVALVTAFFTKLDFPATPAPAPGDAAQAAKLAAAVVSAAVYPDWATMQLNWPSFRGPGGYGVAHYTTAPTDWDGATGKNVKWKVDVPMPGGNSPVVWEKRLFLSGATEDAREVYCFDIETGKLLWKRTLDKFPGTPAKPPKVGEETGFAAPSVVAHGDRVCAIFANGDLACYDFDGNLKWGKNLGVPDNHYGHSSSLIAYKNLLLIQYDQQTHGKLIALDLGDGHEAWTVNRQKISWASPVCVTTSFGVELVLNSEKNVDAYDPMTGKLVWQLECLDGEVAPSPAYGGGMFFVANDNATATAIRLSGTDNAPKPEKAWQWDDALPDVSSPVGSDTHFYVTTSRGQLVCLDRTTGKAAWGQEFDEGFYASPILVGDRIYAIDKKGLTHVFKTGPTYVSIATPKLGEEVFATPAFLDKRIYIRTEKHLFCIANANG